MATTKQAAPQLRSLRAFRELEAHSDHRGMCYHRIHIVLHMVR